MFPAASVAVTVSECGPAAREVYDAGQGVTGAAPSSEQEYVSAEASVLVGPVPKAMPVCTVVPSDAITGPLEVPALMVNAGAVGAVRSMVMVEPSVIAAGPVAPPLDVAPFDLICGITVPSEHPVTVTVKVVDDVAVTPETVQPVAVCADENWKSEVVRLEASTPSLKVSV